jgi:hypothetical protein
MPRIKTKVEENIFIARVNTSIISFKEYDPATRLETDVDWSAVVRMVLKLVPKSGGAAITADTDVDATLIDYGTNGQLTFKLGDLAGLTAGEVYYGRLTAFDGSGDDTELANENSLDAQLIFHATETTTI